MALKDLVADQNQLTEESIEKIVAEYVRYDPNAKVVVFTPKGAALGNDPKILVYLTAILGWKFVVDEAVETSTKPADLEFALGIPGGSLRPALKKLKDTHLLHTNAGHYVVQAANLDSIFDIVSGAKAQPITRKRQKSASGKKKPENDTAKQKTKSNSGELRAMLESWVDDGYFAEPRTLADLLEKYHEKAVITKLSSLSGLCLRAVRDGILSRSKIERDSRLVWAYQAAS